MAPRKVYWKTRAEVCSEPQLKTGVTAPEGIIPEPPLSLLSGRRLLNFRTQIQPSGSAGCQRARDSKCGGFGSWGISRCHPSEAPFAGACCCQTWLGRDLVFFHFWPTSERLWIFFSLALWITLLMLKSTLMKLFPFPQEIFCVNIFLLTLSAAHFAKSDF